MKKVFVMMIAITFLCGGCKSDSDLDAVMELRQQLQRCSCTFDVEVTADYGDLVHVFDLQCGADETGTISFAVTEPETIAGITGIIDAEGGKLTFDDTVLAFELLADGLVTPVSAPWVLIRTLRSGYIHASTETETGTKFIIHDTYEEDALQLDIWFDKNDIPEAAEILWQGKRIVSMTISNFVIL